MNASCGKLLSLGNLYLIESMKSECGNYHILWPPSHCPIIPRRALTYINHPFDIPGNKWSIDLAAIRCGRVSPLLTKRFLNPTTTPSQYWAVIPYIVVPIFLEKPALSPTYLRRSFKRETTGYFDNLWSIESMKSEMKEPQLVGAPLMAHILFAAPSAERNNSSGSFAKSWGMWYRISRPYTCVFMAMEVYG